MSKHLSPEVRVPIERDNVSIFRDEDKCIKCGQCRDMCRDYIGVLGHYSLKATGDRAVCINCGQCANVCPVGSISEVKEYRQVAAAIADPDKIVIMSTSPSVRAALGEEFGMGSAFVQGKMVSLLRALGADYVLDTNFAADLTIMEEASELIERVTKGSKPLPQFTSCCPAWVKFAEIYYPDMLDHISSAKSPIGMQGPTIKTYFAKKMGIDPRKIVNVAVTPCTAKKYEIRREEMSAAGKYLGNEDMRDMDYVITTRELAQWAREAEVDFAALEDGTYDRLMGEGSGAGVIFGNTGGVMEAALRTAYEYITGEKAPQVLYQLEPVRGLEAVKEASLQVGDLTVNVAVIFGTANVRSFIQRMKEGGKQYHFVEVMTCPGGCIGGGGQPKDKEFEGDALRARRIESLYGRDRSMAVRTSHENEEIKELYREFYGQPLSELAEQLLHTSYEDKSRELGAPSLAAAAEEKASSSNQAENTGNAKNSAAPNASTATTTHRFICQICGYVHEGASAPDQCPVCKAGPDKFTEQKASISWPAEHVVGVATGAPEDILADLRANFSGECSEVGMYLAMSRVAFREGYPEIGLYWEQAALEEAEHAAKFAELLGEVVTDSTKENLTLRVAAENGATAGKADLAARAKKLGFDAIHDTVHEMAKDEARHGKAFEGLLKRYFVL